ncbi:5'-nucleotidase [Lacinutrix sp. 5H-3-7-4]|uniref:5' nucleotidase, NT5C type n=1 Tax=Lacinutrix sp. (strain 5H-3-7-4) TaxID=983544 RepID=UPI00020A3B70|nr:5'-nucleotidase [Lacinutrix sp. 5H-3-7-4]AEH01990.1 5 nucleotidase deoxy cytosolic type C [Lacinutrix sp. 5H-3-7-4]
MKKIILIDMDGVLVELGDGPFSENKHKKGFFLNNKPIKGAVEAFKVLSKKYDCYIVTAPVWSNPNCWKEKRLWVEKHLGDDANKRLILTHNKNLVKGDYIIDDTKNYGVDKFEGKHIMFGNDLYPNWKKVLEYFIDK